METRLGARVNIALAVSSKIDKSAEQNITLAKGNRFTATTCDISTVGIGMRTNFFLPKGLVINMDLEGAPFGLREAIKVKGEVRYCNYVKARNYKCGIKFVNLSSRYRQAIAKFVSLHQAKKKSHQKPSKVR
jgi:c-di-GMP-binding flagellar brake protein YcgR